MGRVLGRSPSGLRSCCLWITLPPAHCAGSLFVRSSVRRTRFWHSRSFTARPTAAAAARLPTLPRTPQGYRSPTGQCHTRSRPRSRPASRPCGHRQKVRSPAPPFRRLRIPRISCIPESPPTGRPSHRRQSRKALYIPLLLVFFCFPYISNAFSRPAAGRSLHPFTVAAIGYSVNALCPVRPSPLA